MLMHSASKMKCPLSFGHILLGYLTFTAAQDRQQHVTSAKIQLLDDLYGIHITQQLWQAVSIQPILPATAFHLMRGLSTIITKTGGISRSQVYRAFQESYPALGNQQTWTDLFRRLGNAAIHRLQKLSSEHRPDLAAAAVIINQPQSKQEQDAYLSGVIDWRNASVFLNMEQVARHAADCSLDAYFPVDSTHAEAAAQYFKPNDCFVTKFSLSHNNVSGEYLDGAKWKSLSLP